MAKYNEECPLCHWKFYVDPSVAGDGYKLVQLKCIKCGSLWMYDPKDLKIGTK